MNEHDRALSAAFDSQAECFERAPVQSDPVALERLARKAGFEAGSRVLDAGCGPGLVSEALLAAGVPCCGRRPVARDDRAGSEAMWPLG